MKLWSLSCVQLFSARLAVFGYTGFCPATCYNLDFQIWKLFQPALISVINFHISVNKNHRNKNMNSNSVTKLTKVPSSFPQQKHDVIIQGELCINSQPQAKLADVALSVAMCVPWLSLVPRPHPARVSLPVYWKWSALGWFWVWDRDYLSEYFRKDMPPLIERGNWTLGWFPERCFLEKERAWGNILDRTPRVLGIYLSLLSNILKQVTQH